jgi:hypothetical protein
VRKAGLRDVKLAVAEKKGDLLLKMFVSDWSIPVQTAGMLGTRMLRVRVLDKSGEKELPLSRGALKVLEVDRGILAPLIMEENTNQVFAAVTFDDTAVDFVKFTKLPLEWKAGKELEVKLITKERPPSQYAPIDKVIFYVGKKSLGKIETEDPQEGLLKDGVWSATLKMPEKEGKHEIAVQIWTRTNIVSTASDFIMVKALKPGDVLTTITGKVMGTDKIIWPGATVELKDAKNPDAKSKSTKSDENGKYVFENVPPGAYIIHASRQAGGKLKGNEPVTVAPGMEILTQDITVKR